MMKDAWSLNKFEVQQLDERELEIATEIAVQEAAARKSRIGG